MIRLDIRSLLQDAAIEEVRFVRRFVCIKRNVNGSYYRRYLVVVQELTAG